MRVIDCEYDSNMNPVSVTCEDDGEYFHFECIVYCKDCVYRGNSMKCPMCHDEYAWNEDDDGDWYTDDRTIDEGFCHCGTREYANEEDEYE